MSLLSEKAQQRVLDYFDENAAHQGITPAHELTLRIAKMAEEVGEAIQARIDQTGQNPRKLIEDDGKTYTDATSKLAGEIIDVIFTAHTALHSLMRDYHSAENAILVHTNGILDRAGLL